MLNLRINMSFSDVASDFSSSDDLITFNFPLIDCLHVLQLAITDMYCCIVSVFSCHISYIMPVKFCINFYCNIYIFLGSFVGNFPLESRF